MTKTMFQSAVEAFGLTDVTVTKAGTRTQHCYVTAFSETEVRRVLLTLGGARTQEAAERKAETYRRWLKEAKGTK